MRKSLNYIRSTLLALALIFCFTGCLSFRGRTVTCSRLLTDEGVMSASDLYNFFLKNRPDADKKLVKQMARFYVEEAAIEGINSDCAFVQMCLETGWLRFGGLVTEDMHNYCGLGAMSKEHPGERFATVQEGVRAHIQHLHAYATTEDTVLKQPLIDPRYKYVIPRGKATSIYGLAGTWASDKEYGAKLDNFLSRLENNR